MQILTTIAAFRAARRQVRASGRQLSLVPTMGALHQGHLSLVRAARATGDMVAVSIFVNPTQFGQNEDFTRYPRTFEADCALLEAEQVDFVFAPMPEEMYPSGATTLVRVAGLGERLDGASRPGHFDGVATIVAKLFHIAEPERAFFGQKDAAQVAVLRAMTRDLNFPVELCVCPIIREPDGLAMSSRNRYLLPDEHRQALVLSRALRAAEALAASGEIHAEAILAAAARVLAPEPAVRIDYLALVDPETLETVSALRQAPRQALLAVAAYVGQTRLIDNLLLSSTGAQPSAP